MDLLQGIGINRRKIVQTEIIYSLYQKDNVLYCFREAIV
jgi:hypothetical protein